MIANHLLSVPDPNAMVVTTVQPFPVEVIVRGYISGVTTTALLYRYSLGERQIYFGHLSRRLAQEPGPARADHHAHH